MLRTATILFQVFVRLLGGLHCIGQPPIAKRKHNSQSLLEMSSVNSNNRRHCDKPRYYGANMTDIEKWHVIALMLDRIFFLGFFLALIFSFIFIFPEPMNMFHL